MHFAPGELDLIAPETHDDPWPLYTWLREECPLYRDANGIWCVSRYDDVVYVSRKPGLFHSREGNRPMLPPDESFIHTEGKEHRTRRGYVQESLCSHAVRGMESRIRGVVNKLIDEVIEEGSCDFIEDIAAPLPATLIMSMTGVPEEMHETVRGWMDVFTKGGSGPKQVTEEVNEAYFNFGLLHMDLVEERKACPRHDLLSLWLDKGYTEDQILWEHTMMLVGGSETARNAIASGIEMLAKHPDQRAWLREHPEGIPNAVEEAIRWATPFVSMSRTATQDTELLGQKISKGDEVLMLYPPANRDPRKFDNPDHFDVQRTFRHKQLAFGYGRHFCIGAHLARMEAKVVFEEMLKRLPDWDVQGVQRASSSFIRGIEHMTLQFEPGVRSNRGVAA